MDMIKEGNEYVGESGKTYLAVNPLGQANVWTAVDKANNDIVVLKTPASDDTDASWPRFQHEMIMHELLKDCTAVRKQVDRIPPVDENNSPPVLVLEIFETTLWHARTKRPFTKEEVRSVARQVLKGLKEVHENGLVYADLKMQNVMINGFDTEKAGDISNLVAKLGDLGIVMYPSKGTVQPVAYRAPEVFFKGAITQAADIWGFGLIYSHLLEAIERFDKPGLYDDLYAGRGTMPEREQAMRTALGNDYDLENVDYYKECALPYRNNEHPAGNHWDELRKRGLDEEDVEFLQWILKSDPRRRPSAQTILESDMLNPDTNGTAHSTDETADAAENKATDVKKTANGTDADPPKKETDPGFPALQPTKSSGSKRSRRGADSQDPSKMARPQGIFRGVSTAVFTPGIGMPDNPDSGYLFAKQKEHISPILEHPLVQSVNNEPTGMPEASAETEGGKKVVEAAAEKAGGMSIKREQAPEAPGSDAPALVIDGTTDAQVAGEIDETAKPVRPSHLQHLGKQSSSGGTWLSYK